MTQLVLVHVQERKGKEIRDIETYCIQEALVELAYLNDHKSLSDFLSENKDSIDLSEQNVVYALRLMSQSKDGKSLSIFLDIFNELPVRFLQSASCFCSIRSMEILLQRYGDYLYPLDSTLSMVYVAATGSNFDTCQYLESLGLSMTKENVPLAHFIHFLSDIDDDEWSNSYHEMPDEKHIKAASYII